MAITFVRESGSATGTATPQSVTITAGANGNVLIAWITSNRGASAARTVSSIASTNTTWAKLTGASITNGSMGLEIWAGKISGGSSGTTVTVTMSGTVASGLATEICEFAGELSTITVDGTAATSTGTSTGPTTNNTFANTLQDSLILSAVGYESSTGPTGTPASPWTVNTFRGTSSAGVSSAYLLPLSTPGNHATSWTIGSTGDVWGTVIVALKSATQTLSPTKATATFSGQTTSLKLSIKPATTSATFSTSSPTLKFSIIKAPASQSLTFSTVTPTLKLSLPITKQTLTFSTFTPTVTIGTRLSPSTASSTFSTFTPTLKLSLAISKQSLTFSTATPTIKITIPKSPATATATFNTFSPKLLLKLAAPASQSLTFTGQAVTITNAPLVVTYYRNLLLLNIGW